MSPRDSVHESVFEEKGEQKRGVEPESFRLQNRALYHQVKPDHTPIRVVPYPLPITSSSADEVVCVPFQ